MSNVCECGAPLHPARTSQMAAENYVRATVARVTAMVAMVEHGDRPASRLVQDGGRFTEQLHSVMHDPAFPGVNYFKIARWVRKTEKLADRYGITGDRVDAFVQTHF